MYSIECNEGTYPCVREPFSVRLYPRLRDLPGLVLGGLRDDSVRVPLGPIVLAYIQGLDLLRGAEQKGHGQLRPLQDSPRSLAYR